MRIILIKITRSRTRKYGTEGCASEYASAGSDQDGASPNWVDATYCMCVTVHACVGKPRQNQEVGFLRVGYC